MNSPTTVHQQTYDLLRQPGLTTFLRNPGSTEEIFLQNFPNDFSSVLGLQEASIVAMANGCAQATGKPAFVNLHMVAGMAMPWATPPPRGSTKRP